MKVFFLLVLAVCQLSHAAEKYDENIDPKLLWVAFAEYPEVSTSDFDELKRVKISCPYGGSYWRPGFEIDTDLGVMSFPGTDYYKKGAHEYMTRNACATNISLPPSAGPSCTLHSMEYLELSAFKPVKVPSANPDETPYVNVGPIPLNISANSIVKCRWLRMQDKVKNTYPPVALYCGGGPFFWRHQVNRRSGERVLYDIEVPLVHAEFVSWPTVEAINPDSDTIPGMLGEMLNTIQIKRFDTGEVQSMYSPMIKSGLENKLFGKDYLPFAKRKVQFESQGCKVEIENVYQGEE